MYYQKNCECPCKYDPIVMPTKECVYNKCVYVEQPIILPMQKKIITHYVPKPVYYRTYSQCEETVCEPPLNCNQFNNMNHKVNNPFKE